MDQSPQVSVMGLQVGGQCTALQSVCDWTFLKFTGSMHVVIAFRKGFPSAQPKKVKFGNGSPYVLSLKERRGL